MPGWAGRPSAASRGYGGAHQRLRRQWAPRVATGRVVCAKHGHPQHPDCPGLIEAGSAWELGHTDDRSGYTGPEHAGCNQRAGRLLAAERRPRQNRPAEPHPGMI
jgi:hypothetical protein